MQSTTLKAVGNNLAADINEAHAACCEAVSQSLHYAMRCGDLLIQAKAECEHGEWLAWLDDNFESTPRTAQNYMRLASNRDLIEANTKDASHLGVDQAVKLLTTKAGPQKPAFHMTAARSLLLEVISGRRDHVELYGVTYSKLSATPHENAGPQAIVAALLLCQVFDGTDCCKWWVGDLTNFWEAKKGGVA